MEFDPKQSANVNVYYLSFLSQGDICKGLAPGDGLLKTVGLRISG